MAAAVWALALPVSAFQARMGTRVSVPRSAMTQSDLYLLGWRVDVEGEVNGDLVVLGGTVRVHAPVHGDVYVAGGSVEISGPVEGSINLLGLSLEAKSGARACRLLGLDAIHSGITSGDLLAFGALVVSGGRVGGDTVLGGEEVELKGRHVGTFLAMAHQVDIAGLVQGDAKIKADQVTLGPGADLQGNLEYTSSREMGGETRSVRGEIVHRYPPPGLPKGFRFPWLYPLLRKLFSALWLTVVGLASLTWFPRSTQSVVNTMLHLPWESFGVGLVLFIAVPGLAILLVISLLGLPLGLFLFGLFGIGVYLTRLFASLYIGERLLQALEHHQPPYWQSLPLGVLLFTALTSIPWIGFLVSFVAIPLALGAKALLGWRVYRRMRYRHMA